MTAGTAGAGSNSAGAGLRSSRLGRAEPEVTESGAVEVFPSAAHERADGLATSTQGDVSLRLVRTFCFLLPFCC